MLPPYWLLVLAAGAPSPYSFDGPPSRAVLEAYLDRAATTMALVGHEHRPDQIRFVLNCGIKFAGRAFIWWGSEAWHDQLLTQGEPLCELLHRLDPELILQGCIFEIITTSVNDIAVPAWVFEEFGEPAEERPFRYADMLYPDGTLVDHWHAGASVPDITRLETQRWFYYVARRYLDAGFEALHLGQVELMGRSDPDHEVWWQLTQRIRAYAAVHARRHWVFLDAHTPRFGLHYGEDRLILDAHAMPLRPVQIADRPRETELRVGWLDTLYGRSQGGLAPAGWRCDSLPYLVELDNWGSSGRGGELVNEWWAWGWDEICWFAHQPAEYRHRWLAESHAWLQRTDPGGSFQMPAARCLADPVDGRAWYYANTPGPDLPEAFGDEEAIKAIWGHRSTNCRDALRDLGEDPARWTADGAVFCQTADTQPGLPVGAVSLRPGGRLRYRSADTGRMAIAVQAGDAGLELTVDGRRADLDLAPISGRDDVAGRVVVEVREDSVVELARTGDTPCAVLMILTPLD